MMNKFPKMSDARKDRGTVLVLTCATVVIVAILVAELSMKTAVDYRIASSGVDDLANRQAVFSAVEVMRQMGTRRSADDEGGRTEEPSVHELGDTRFQIRFVDEESKINVNRLVDAQGRVDQKMRERVAALLAQFVHDPDIVADRLVDYMDTDDKGSYENGAKNAPLDTIDELLYIDGITNAIFFGDPDAGKPGLRDCVTIESSGAVNINSAPAPVLRAIWPDLDNATIEAIIRARAEKPFKSITELLERGLVDHSTFNILRESRVSVAGSRTIAFVDTETGSVKKTYKVALSGGSRSRVLYVTEVRK
jgi:type II secretory pathway component PulK